MRNNAIGLIRARHGGANIASATVGAQSNCSQPRDDFADPLGFFHPARGMPPNYTHVTNLTVLYRDPNNSGSQMHNPLNRLHETPASLLASPNRRNKICGHLVKLFWLLGKRIVSCACYFMELRSLDELLHPPHARWSAGGVVLTGEQ